jgi:hypothetical protein
VGPVTARDTLVTTLTNLFARTRNGRMDAHRAEAERLVAEALTEQACGLSDVVRAMDRGVIRMSGRRVTDVDLIADVIRAADFDALLRASEQRADEKRKARVYPYDLEVGQ